MWKQPQNSGAQKLQEEADEVPVFKDSTATCKSIEFNAVGASLWQRAHLVYTGSQVPSIATQSKAQSEAHIQR